MKCDGKEEMTLDFLDFTHVEYEEAVLATKFGKFHYFLLAICGLIYLNTAVGITIISFVLPSATCGKQFSQFTLSLSLIVFLFIVDFQMTSADKGKKSLNKKRQTGTFFLIHKIFKRLLDSMSNAGDDCRILFLGMPR